MKTYKLRHKPTGLFYKPSKHRSKANLSKLGKAYSNKPGFGHIGKTYRHPLPKVGRLPEFEERHFIPEEWEIVEFRVVEEIVAAD